ncbi:MAG: nucleoside transporter C-terminal domain-containing protein [Candidatus Latescibacterota bacterium]|nr:nucleoside transporter C-terminal domain-containing protein [Candidatus Latescibacterota bacterium]
MTDSLHSAGGYVALLSIAWLVGTRRGKIPLRTLAVATGLQVVLTALLLLTGLRGYVFGVVGGLTDLLKATALKANESLLFIGVTNPDFVATYGPMVALEIAAVIVFVASLSRVLYHHGILPWLIGVLSRFVQRAFGISAAESVGVVGNVFLGMTEAPLLIRPYIDRLTLSELFCLMTAGMATIAGTVMVVYASMLSAAHPEIAGHLFTASLISAPAAVAIAKLMMPETDTPATGSEVRIDKDDTINALDAAARGASEGMLLFINILAMLIAFIGLVALVNGVIACLEEALIGADASGTWSLEAMLGWLFRLPVWFMGVSWQEAEVVGSLMGVKTILNEFVAYVQLSSLMADGEQALSERSFLIAVYAMCGFANVGSVAIMIGGIGGIAPSRRGDLARLGLRSVVSGTIATMLTGCVVGVFV